MVANKHTAADLKQMQSLPLEMKIQMTKRRIRDWYEHFEGQVYVSFSGGKDSTVLKHIVDSMYSDVPAVFVNTGLEYPEIQTFVREVKAGKYDCFNSDVEILRPEMRFDEVIKKYGYPVISKEVSNAVHYAKLNIPIGKETLRVRQLKGMTEGRFDKSKWLFLVDSPFDIDDACCNVMKKKPFKQYNKRTARKAIVGTMACESQMRLKNWIRLGCNAFEATNPSSQPMSFWTEQDVLEYIVKYEVPYASVYGQIYEEGELEGQMYIDGYHGKLCTSGENRTGCIFCMFGCHIDKEPNRFQRLKETHPKQYEYCINGGEYDEDGKWQPSKEWLGIGKVLDYIGVKYD
jgi:3'-phosphoadenosine 5'-phosphosulfate sulfotransferase (PAPS reductase)/FAD synthetase